MKNLNLFNLRGYLPFNRSRRSIAFLFIVVILSGCSTYYRVTTTAYPAKEQILEQIAENRIFVVHSGDKVFVIKNVAIENDSVKGEYLMDYRLPVNRETFPLENRSAVRYRKNEERLELEVHFYVGDRAEGDDIIALAQAGKPLFSIKDIYRYDVNNRNMNTTIFTYAVGVVVITAAVITGGTTLLFLLTW